jgi:hypothetical protein
VSCGEFVLETKLILLKNFRLVQIKNAKKIKTPLDQKKKRRFACCRSPLLNFLLLDPIRKGSRTLILFH